MFDVVCKALKVGNEKVAMNSEKLRANVSQELGKNAKMYARQLWQNSVETVKSTSDSFVATVLVQSCLSTPALEAFEQAHHKPIKLQE